MERKLYVPKKEILITDAFSYLFKNEPIETGGPYSEISFNLSSFSSSYFVSLIEKTESYLKSKNFELMHEVRAFSKDSEFDDDMISEDYDNRYRLIYIQKSRSNMVINIDRWCITIFIPNSCRKEMLEIVAAIKGIYDETPTSDVEEEIPRIRLFSANQEGLHLRNFNIPPRNIDLDLNYSEGFKEFDKSVDNFILNETDGLILLFGERGTGKTNYLRHVMTKHSIGKNLQSFIYFPPGMAESIAEPGFIDFAATSGMEGSTFIIEDGEKALRRRDIANNSNVSSNLLNLTDGLLGDCLKIKIIGTFNCDRKEVDEALLREGRLYNEFEFKRLTIEGSILLARKLGIENFHTDKGRTLAEIYNWKGEGS